VSGDALAGLRIRPSARALVVDDADRVLLLRFEVPDLSLWATPGGGIEPGEDASAALRRELREELDLELPDDCAHVWTRLLVTPLLGGTYDGQREDFWLVRCPPFPVEGLTTLDLLRAEGVHEVRWWSPAELAAARGVTFAPRRLPELLDRLLAEGPPAVPVDTGE
jgi:ADP-ribose pyrophosphatase YjhB (NUDIX family)